jgi:hypothetical protein
MLYVTLSLGGRTANRLYGLRVDQGRQASAMPGSTQVLAIHGRELLDLQFAEHAQVRINLARRLTWDFNRREFGLSGAADGSPMHLPTHAPAIVALAAPR